MSSIAGAASQPGSLWRAARKDPELYAMAFLVASTFSVFSFYFGRHSTTQMHMGEERINIAEKTAPLGRRCPRRELGPHQLQVHVPPRRRHQERAQEGAQRRQFRHRARRYAAEGTLRVLDEGRRDAR